MIKVTIIALTLGLTVGAGIGWYAKGRDVKADQAEALQASLTEFKTTAQSALDGLQESWEHQAQLNYDRLVFAGQLRAEDDNHETAVLEQIKENNRELQEIMEKFAMAGDLGACQLTPEFVGLWNKARATVANDPTTDEYDPASRSNEP